MLRSERMGYYRLVVPKALAWEMANLIGEMGENMVQFVDCNREIDMKKRLFSSRIKRCDEIQEHLAKIKNLLIEYEFEVEGCDNVEEFLANLRKFLETRDREEKTYIEDIDFEIASFCRVIFENDDKIRKL